MTTIEMAGRTGLGVDETRYEQLELVGTGGMGRVFKAWDRLLRRHVALKILIHDANGSSSRFLREAAAQAQIDHQNVCRIYDSGVANGQVYIAMQYIEGEPLSVAKNTLTLEEKVRAIAEAARGLHAAHRHGIIHRDIKPSNLMSWRDNDGSLRVAVLDFGLARDLNDSGSTITGAVLGTLQYMPPEQAAGDHHRIDRRSDVYSLGATLHELLVGRAPFEAETPVASMMAILFNEPESFAAAHAIPRDLETIVLKCLEKEQHRRYDSAGDLADDLERYLAGEPIRARPAPLHRVLIRRIRRNRALAVAMLAGAAFATIIGVVAVQRASVRSEQAILAERFGEDARYIESLLLHANRSPLHDVRAERRQAAEHLKQLEKTIAAAGVRGRGPGAGAAGAVQLALGDVDAAAVLLDDAWKLGPRTPQLAYTLGELRGRQYQRRLVEINAIADAEERERERRKADTQFRLPALEFLRLASGVKAQSPGYLDALISYYDGRLEESLRRLGEVGDRYPWLYEARLLAARARIEIGNQHRAQGNQERAFASYTAADRDLENAIATAPSDPEVHTERCRLWRNILEFQVQFLGGDARPQLQDAVSACTAALTASPDSVAALNHLSGVYTRYVQWQLGRDEDFRDAAEKACAAADRAVALAPEVESNHTQRSFAYFMRSTSNAYSQEERLRHAAEAQASAEHATRLDRNLTHAYVAAGNAALARHNLIVINGGDPRDVLREAIAAYQRAIALNPALAPAYNNLGHAYTHLGDYQRLIGEDPTASYLKAAESGARGHAANRGFWSLPLVIANARRLLTEDAVRKDEPSAVHATEAIRWTEVANRAAPREAGPYTVKALTLLAVAEERRRNGESHADVREQMVGNIDQALALAPESVYTYRAAALVALWNVRHGGLSHDAKVRALDSVLARRDVLRKRHPESAEILMFTSLLARERAALEPSERAADLAVARAWRTDAFALNELLSSSVESEYALR